MSPEPGFLSISEMALYLNVCENTLREWIRTKNCPCYQPAWKILLKPHEVEAWMATRKRAKQRKKPTTVGRAAVTTAASGGSTTTPT